MKDITTNRIEQFREALQSGIDGIMRASRIYVEVIDEDPRNGDKFREEFSEWVPSSAWVNFEAVGRKWMHPKLLMGGVSDKSKQKIIKNAPYSLQERMFNGERFDLLTHNGDILKVSMKDATAKQLEQICGDGTLKTMSEQRAFIEAQRVPESEPVEVMPYTINNGKVRFRRAVELTRQELKRLLQEM